MGRPSATHGSQCGLTSGINLLKRLENFWVLGLKLPIHGDVLRRVLAKEDQRVSDGVGLVDGGRDFSTILFFASARMPGGASMKQTGIDALLFSLGLMRLYGTGRDGTIMGL